MGILAGAVLAACTTGEGSGPSEAAPSPTASPAIVDGEPCPPAPEHLDLPPEAGCASSTSSDFEPDEDAQTFIAYALVDQRRLPEEWHLRVTRDDGDHLDQRVAIGSDASYPLVLGAEDADGRGLDEAFVKVLSHSYHSGKTYEVAMFGVRKDRFFQIEADGEPLVFQIGGVSVFGQGAECRDVNADGRPEFLVLYIDGVHNEVQETVERIYSWRNRSLSLMRREEGRLVKTGYSDPLLWRYYSLRCFDFEPPYPFKRG
ncbi:MAG: hypothetical protein M3174_07665 [Actinomycetota bacterium]|nr:hypothetical protein [Actinomycetota bacterium]